MVGLLLCTGSGKAAQIETWLNLGPVEIDVTKEFEHLQIYGLDRVGAKLRPDQDAEVKRLAASAPEEGSEAEFFGKRARWQLLRLTYPERLATWARTGGHPILWTNILQTMISSDRKDVKISLEAIGGVRVFLNGAPVYQANWPGGRYDVRKRHEIALNLAPGENNLMVMLFAIHLHTATAFYAETDHVVKTKVRWNDLNGERAELERDFSRLYAAPWLLGPGAQLSAGIAGKPSRFPLEFERSDAPGVRAELPPNSSSVKLAGGSGSLTSRFTVRSSAKLNGASRIDGPQFNIEIAEAPPAVGKDWDFERRRQYVLETVAASPQPAKRALARAALGRAVSLEELQPALAHLANRTDTADFTFHDLIRLYYQFPERLSPAAREAIRHAAINFKYWMDEPGPSSMFMKSENHQILFHTLQFMTGILFPRDTFVELGAPGTVQALKGRMLATEWMDARLRFGFEEWLSPGYLEKDVQAMLNLVDVPDDDNRMASTASRVLDLLFLYMCSHEWNGYLHTTYGRAYMRQVAVPHTQDAAALIWLLTGKGAARIDSGVLALALSSYRPPTEILRFSQPDAPALTRTQQGRGSRGSGASTMTLRNSRYVLSTLIDYRKGERGAQAHAVQATLPGGVPVFINGAVSTSDTSRPGFWLGNSELPRAFQHGDLSIVIYRQRDRLAFSHCFFPAPWLERTALKNGWIAGEKAGAYVAVYSQGGVQLTPSGLFRDYEIAARNPDNIWLVKVGSIEQYASLDAFLTALPKPAFADGNVELGDVRAGWNTPLSVAGKIVPTDGFPLIGNDWVNAEYGVGSIRVRTPFGPELLTGR